MKRLIVLWTLLGSAACGGSSFSGAVSGKTLNVKDTVFALLPATGTDAEKLYVVLTDTSDTCSDMHNGLRRKNSTALLLTVPAASQSVHVALGTASIASTGASALFLHIDANCSPTSIDGVTMPASSGSVAVDSLAPTTKSTGTFNLTFGADKISGQFSASYCADLLGYLTKVYTGLATCQ